MSKVQREETFYGSGKVYSRPYVKQGAGAFPVIADPSAVTAAEVAELVAYLKATMVSDYQIGYLKNGFDVKIDTNTLSDHSDLGEMKIDVITEETGTCTFSLFNCSIDVIADQYPTAAYSKDPTSQIEVAEVGGLANMDDTEHVIVFYHSDTQNGDTIAICVGKNMSGFENAWKQDAVTPFTCTFNMRPFTTDGRFYRLVHSPAGYDWSDTPVTPTVSSIAMKTQPTKTTYAINDELDVTGAVITATYSDSTTADVNVTSAMCSGFDSSTAGEKTVTVTYQSKTTTFTVTVSE